MDPRVSELLMFPSFGWENLPLQRLGSKTQELQELSPLDMFKAPAFSTFPRRDGQEWNASPVHLAISEQFCRVWRETRYFFFFSLWYLQDRYEFRLFLEKKGNPGVHGSVLSSDHPLGGLLEPIPGAFSPVGLATFFKTKIITEELKVLEGK